MRTVLYKISLGMESSPNSPPSSQSLKMGSLPPPLGPQPPYPLHDSIKGKRASTLPTLQLSQELTEDRIDWRQKTPILPPCKIAEKPSRGGVWCVEDGRRAVRGKVGRGRSGGQFAGHERYATSFLVMDQVLHVGRDAITFMVEALKGSFETKWNELVSQTRRCSCRGIY